MATSNKATNHINKNPSSEKDKPFPKKLYLQLMRRPPFYRLCILPDEVQKLTLQQWMDVCPNLPKFKETFFLDDPESHF